MQWGFYFSLYKFSVVYEGQLTGLGGNRDSTLGGHTQSSVRMGTQGKEQWPHRRLSQTYLLVVEGLLQRWGRLCLTVRTRTLAADNLFFQLKSNMFGFQTIVSVLEFKSLLKPKTEQWLFCSSHYLPSRWFPVFLVFKLYTVASEKLIITSFSVCFNIFVEFGVSFMVSVFLEQSMILGYSLFLSACVACDRALEWLDLSSEFRCQISWVWQTSWMPNSSLCYLLM